ncbi:MAG: hypothetical protein IIC60_15270 [Proteobacteria bacterium]|nr:hypothetical protein [Pseudomonadota bacterium]
MTNMKISHDHWLAADASTLPFFMLAMACIVAAAALGLVTSVKGSSA